MNTQTYYQLDRDNCYVCTGEAREFVDDPGRFNVPYKAVIVAPPSAPSGSVAHWDGAWEVVYDFRKTKLYIAANGQEYTLGNETEDGSYNGLGAIPTWLVDVPPTPEPQPEPQNSPTTVKLISGDGYRGFEILSETTPPPANSALMRGMSNDVITTDTPGNLIAVSVAIDITFTNFKPSGALFISEKVTVVPQESFPKLTGVNLSALQETHSDLTNLIKVVASEITDRSLTVRAFTTDDPGTLVVPCTFRIVGNLPPRTTWQDSEIWDDSEEWAN
ncbi:MAG: hypothetical protein LBE24_03975 [Methylobacillus sp.]|jgi:hypothetical protein|nr:hypothetical protein [Methylobacillus sp.]